MIVNGFEVEKLSNNDIKVTSLGAFSKEYHLKADEFLAFMVEQAGGAVVKRKTPPKPHEHKTESHHSH